MCRRCHGWWECAARQEEEDRGRERPSETWCRGRQETEAFARYRTLENIEFVTWLHQAINSLRPSDAYICVSKLTIIGSDNGLSPGRRQAIIWTNAGILLIRTLGTNFSEILGKIHSFSFKKMHLKISSAKGRLFSPGLNELTETMLTYHQQSCRAILLLIMIMWIYNAQVNPAHGWKHGYGVLPVWWQAIID